MVNFSSHTNVYLNNQPCLTKYALIDLNPDECNQGLRFYPFMVNFDRCNWSYNTLNETSVKICVPNKI